MSIRISSLTTTEAHQLLATRATSRSFAVCRGEAGGNTVTFVYSVLGSDVHTQPLPNILAVETQILKLGMQKKEGVTEKQEELFRSIKNPRWYQEITLTETPNFSYDQLLLQHEEKIKHKLKKEEVGTFIICYETAKKVFRLYSKRCVAQKATYESVTIQLGQKAYVVNHGDRVATYTSCRELRAANGLFGGPKYLAPRFKIFSPAVGPSVFRPIPIRPGASAVLAKPASPRPKDTFSPILPLESQSHAFQPRKTSPPTSTPVLPSGNPGRSFSPPSQTINSSPDSSSPPSSGYGSSESAPNSGTHDSEPEAKDSSPCVLL